MQPGSKTLILPPLLSLRFAERRATSIVAGNSESTLVVSVSFEDDLSWWNQIEIVACVIGGVLAAALWAKRVFCWARKNHLRQSAQFLVTVVVQGASSFADVFFWVLFAEAAYCFVFFKGQTAVSVLPPKEDSLPMRAFAGILVAVFTCKVAALLLVLYRQCSIDLFFVDWEKPRGKLMPRGAGEKPANAPVSVWRSLFSINEWNELQLYRVQSTELTIVVVAFALYGASALWWAKPEPSSSDLSSVPKTALHPLFLFALCTLAWAGSALAQLVVYHVLRLKWVPDEAITFVDLVSLANVSVLAMDDDAHGWYIHGRSVHACADTTLAGMNANLRAEANKQTATRGLLPNNDAQIFEVFMTPSLAQEMRQLYFALIHRERAGPEASSMADSATRALGFREKPPADELVRAHKAMSALIRGIISHSDAKHDFVMKTELTAAQRVLGIPPDMTVENAKTTFIPSRRGYVSLFILGCEYDLAILFASLLTLVAWYTRSPATGLFVAYIADRLFVWARKFFGERNIGFKTLADSRFLI